MKKIQNLSESQFLRLFFAFTSVCFMIGAAFMPDVEQIYSGLWNIMSRTCKISTNYFALGGYAATFMNMGLVGLFCTLLCCLPGSKPNQVTTLGVLLTIGFASWGMNLVNMLPTVLGVCLYAAVKKEKLGAVSNAMLYSTGIAPLISDLLFRYPGVEYVGFNWLGFGIALFVGLIIGFFLPAGLVHAPNIHKGYDLYSAAVPIGMTAFFLRTVLYNVMLGWKIGDLGKLSTMAALDIASWENTNIFCFVVFGLCIVMALLMGCKPKDYWALLKDSGHGACFTTKYGYAPFLMNVGLFGLMIVGYFNLAGAIDGRNVWTGMTFGIVFCMLATCNSGSHPGNVWPIMAGYMIASFLFGWIFKLLGGETYGLTIGSQSILIGLCYANGMSPVSGKYGFGYGILAGGLHYLLVSAVPDMHGGFCLYNGGFTAALICLMLVPQLEKFCKTKEERRLVKAAK
ncbi:MAG: DUF1576 domain-containing protein [Oscillospiraceae bacterium]|nr:DUF1576 domain-containing protein [Oscillospiraceae bacterium]